MYIHMRVYTYMYICTYACVHVYLYILTCLSLALCLHRHVCMYIHMYIYIQVRTKHKDLHTYIHTYIPACILCTLRSQQSWSSLSAMAAFTGGRASSDLADPTKTPSLARVSEETCNAPGHCTVQEWPHYPTQGGVYSLTRIAWRPCYALHASG